MTDNIPDVYTFYTWGKKKSLSEEKKDGVLISYELYRTRQCLNDSSFNPGLEHSNDMPRI